MPRKTDKPNSVERLAGRFIQDFVSAIRRVYKMGRTERFMIAVGDSWIGITIQKGELLVTQSDLENLQREKRASGPLQ